MRRRRRHGLQPATPSGGTPPFGHPEPVRTFCDPDLLGHEVVWAAAGTPDSVFPLTPADLVRWTGAEVAEFGESPAS